MEIQHFSHDHKLIFCHGKNDGAASSSTSSTDSCYLCKKPITNDGTDYYKCDECNIFLHKTCAEIPHNIKVHSHRKHQLTLSLNRQDAALFANTCDFCLANIVDNYFYTCQECNFCLHADCASTSIAEHHQHQFSLLKRSDDFICDACGTESFFSSVVNHPFIICTSCHVVVHRDCVSLPKSISILQHPHVLAHTYVIQETKPFRTDCTICRTTVDPGYGSYYCNECCFVVHVNCALKNLVVEDENSIVPVNEIIQKDDLPPAYEDLPPAYEKHEQYVQDHGHDHEFIVEKNESADNKYCDGCISPISTCDTYHKCKECDLILDETCNTLPWQIKHPTHEHTLFPLLKAPGQNGTFSCCACHHVCHGFSYHCKKCPEFYLCTRCMSLPSILNHDGHDHPLSLVLDSKCQCSSCGGGSLNYFMFQCTQKECSFALDFTCAIAPRTIMHKNYEDHPFVLTYKSEGNETNEYYCDICERERDSNNWFYYCSHYDHCAHLKCAMGKYPYLKLGREIKLPLLPSVQKTSDYVLCDECSVFSSLTLLPLVNLDFFSLALCFPTRQIYLCCLCENPLSRDELFYYDKEYDNGAHLQCVVGDSFTQSLHQSITVNLIDRKMDHRRCLVCGEYCRELSLECTKIGCYFSIHFDCGNTMLVKR